MFILCLGILFFLIKNGPNIKWIGILEYCYPYTVYADDTIFFLKDENSIVHLSKKFRLFSDFSGLKRYTIKCEIAGIDVLKEVQEVGCGMRCIDLRNEDIKILSIYFSYNQEIKDE